MFYLVLQSRGHKFIILELKLEDLMIHNTVKIKRKTDYCREVRHNYTVGVRIDSMEHFRKITSTNGSKKCSQQ